MNKFRFTKIYFFFLYVIGALSSSSGFCFWSKDIGYFEFGVDDHEVITRHALQSFDSTFPDLQSQTRLIVDGGSTEGIHGIGAHTKVDDATTKYWAGNDTQWAGEFLKNYLALSFNEAYKQIGFYIHLRQDSFVPAHQKNIFHGLFDKYEKSPQEPNVFITQSGTYYDSLFHIDEFEKFTSNNHIDNIPPDINFDLPFLDPTTNCNSRFWYGDNEDGDEGVDEMGSYGQPTNQTCEIPSTNTGADWYADAKYLSLTMLAERISHGQLYLARVATVEALENISKALPPLITNLSASKFPLNGENELQISFRVLENRTPNITYALRLLKSDGSFIRNVQEGIPLQLTRASDELPFSGYINNFSWDGKIAGQFIDDGEYILDVRATDSDQNSTPDAVNFDSVKTNDTRIEFSMIRCSPNEPDIRKPFVTLDKIGDCFPENIVAITGKAIDNCSLSSLEVNGVSVDVSTSGGSFSVNLNLEDGEYSITATAKDSAGNISTSDPLKLKVDTKPPQLLNFTPLEGESDVLLNAQITATYDEELDAGEIQISGTELAGVSRRNGKVIEYTHDGLQGDSTYRVTLAGIKDKCGNESEDFWSFSTSAVNAYITRPDRNDPTNKQWKQVKHIHVEGLISNPEEGATIDVCGDIPEGKIGCQQLTMSPGVKQKWSAEFEIPLEVEGTAKFKMTAVYKKKTVSDTVDVLIDNKAPVLQIGPSEKFSTEKDRENLSAVAIDRASKLRSIEFIGQGLQRTEPSDISSDKLEGYVRGLKFGDNDIEVKAEDQVGNVQQKKIQIKRTGKAAWFVSAHTTRECNIVHEKDPVFWDVFIGGTPGLEGTLNYSPAGEGGWSSSHFTIGPGGTTLKYVGTKTGIYAWTVLVENPGTHEVLLKDNAKQGISPCVKADPTFITDPTQNEISALDPIENKFYSTDDLDFFENPYQARYSSTTILIEVFNSAGENIRTIVDDVKISGSYVAKWDGKDSAGNDVPEGTYQLVVEQHNAEDFSQANTQTIAIEIDSTPPIVRIEKVEGESSNPRLFNIYGMASDKNLEKIIVDRVQDNLVEPVLIVNTPQNGEPTLLGTIDATAWQPGKYFLRLGALDKSGNESWTVENSTSETPPSFPIVVAPIISTGALHLQAAIGSQAAISAGNEVQSADNPDVFLDDDLPQNATVIGNWNWTSSFAYSGVRSHVTYSSDTASGQNFTHYFIHADPGLSLQSAQNIIQYVYLSPDVQEILLQFYTDQGDGEHRVFWGKNSLQTTGQSGTASLINGGALPPPNKWVRLKIPTDALGLSGKVVKGILFSSIGGTTYWDKTTTSNKNLDPGGFGYSIPQSDRNADDSTQTTLVYAIDKDLPLKIDVLSRSGLVVKTMSGVAGDPTCCTAGQHDFVWDQKSNNGTDSSDGLYSFLVTSSSGPFDTEAYGIDPLFNPSSNSYPSTFSQSTKDSNQNSYFIDVSSQGMSRVGKKNANGLFVNFITTDSLVSLSGIAVDSENNLFTKTNLGLIQKWKPGTVPFETKSINALIRVPWKGNLVKATVPIIGAATARGFQNYVVDIGAGWADQTNHISSWTVLNTGLSEVQDQFVFPVGQETIYGNLASWETGLTPGEEYPIQDIFHPQTGDRYRGRWTVRLTVNTVDLSSRSMDVPVIVGRVLNNMTGAILRSDDDQVEIYVPSLALHSDWEIMAGIHHIPVSYSTNASLLLNGKNTPPFISADIPAIPSDLKLVSRIYEMIPAGYDFNRPVRFSLAISTESQAEKNVALYQYDWKQQRWVFLSSNLVQESSGTLNKTSLVYEALTSFPAPRALFGVFSHQQKPSAPVLYQVKTPTSDRFLQFQGRGNANSELAIYSVNPSTDIFPVITNVDDEGRFLTPISYFKPGMYQFAAIQSEVGRSISGGGLSDPSNFVSVVVTSGSWVQVASFTFTEADFVTIKRGNFKNDDIVHLRLVGSDPNSNQIDHTYVRLYSTVSDPDGIMIPLYETFANSGIYTGRAHLASTTDPTAFNLAATVKGEKIEAIAESNPAKKCSLYFDSRTKVAVPLIASYSHPSLFQQTFENDLGQWAPFDALAGAEVSYSTYAASGVGAVHLEQKKPNGNFSTVMSTIPFSVKEFPLLSFDVMMENPVRFNLFFKVQGTWLELVLNDAGETPKTFPPSFDVLGSYLPQQKLAALRADGTWQRVEINLFNYLRAKYPNAEADQFKIEEIILGDWDAQPLFGITNGKTPIGSWVNIDNFIVTNSGVADSNPLFTLNMPTSGLSETDISYSYTLDQYPNTIPKDFVNLNNSAVRLFDVPSGEYYFHVRARDRNENWSAPNHYRILVDNDSPTLLNPTPAPLSHSDLLVASLEMNDSLGAGINPDSIRFSVNGTTYDYTSPAFNFDSKSQLFSVTLGKLKDAVIDGQFISLSVDEAEDWAGNKITQKFQWGWQVDFSRFSGGDFSPLTLKGGREASWAADSKQIVFVSDRSGQTELWVMSSSDTAEAFHTPTQLTDDHLDKQHPDWAPNGKWVVYATGESDHHAISLLNLTTRNSQKLTQSSADESSPSWSHDGRKIVFSRLENSFSRLFILNINPETGAVISEEPLTKTTVGYDLDPVWSTDDQRIVYRRQLYSDNIFEVNVDGTNPHPLTTSNFESAPSVRWPGGKIAFVSKRNNSFETIWSMQADGTGQEILLENKNLWADSEPRWAPDGDHLAFTTLRSGVKNISLLSLLEISNLKVSPQVFSPRSAYSKVVEISYGLSSVSHATLQVSGPNGFQETLFSDLEESNGSHSHQWNGLNAKGQELESGAYTFTLTIKSAAAPAPIVKQAAVKIDRNPPVVWVLPSRDFTNTSSSISFSIEENPLFPSGIGNIFYGIDLSSSDVPTSLYRQPFQVALGSHTVSYFGEDLAGNRTVLVNKKYVVEDTPPQMSVSFGGPQFVKNGNLIISTQTAIQILASDVFSSTSLYRSGIQRVSAQIDSFNLFTPTIASEIKIFLEQISQGFHTIKVQAEDGAGNSSETSFRINLDSTPPSISLSFSPSATFNGVHDFITPETIVKFNSFDIGAVGGSSDASGVKSIYYTVNQGTMNTLSPGQGFRFLEGGNLSGNIHLTTWVEDNVGNISSPVTRDLILSTAPPHSLVSLVGPRVAQTVSAKTQFILQSVPGFTADALELNLDRTGFQRQSNGYSFKFNTEGEHLIEFRAIVQGVPESTESMSVLVDTTPPTTNLSGPAISTGIYNQIPTIWIRANDYLNLVSTENSRVNVGVSNIFYSIDGSTQNYTKAIRSSYLDSLSVLKVWSTDLVGNVEKFQTFNLIVDGSAPIPSFKVLGQKFVDQNVTYISSTSLVELNGVDQGLVPSGVKEFSYSIGDEFFKYDHPISFSESKVYRLKVIATDQVQNNSNYSAFFIGSDKAAPQVRIETVNSIEKEGIIYVPPLAKLVPYAPDDLSGLLSLSRSIDGGDWVETNDAFSLPTGGTHTVRLKATDRVLNETILTKVFYGEDIPPTSSIHFSSSLVEETTTFISATTQISFASVDDGAGVQDVFYLLDPNAAPIKYVGPLTLPEGQYSIQFFAVDKLNNVEAKKGVHLVVDGTAPQTSVQFLPTPFSNGFQTFISTSFSLVTKTSELQTVPYVGVTRIEISTVSLTEGFFFSVSTAPSASQFISTVSLTLPIGKNRFMVRSVDAVGNVSASQIFDLIVGTSIPSVSISFSGPHYIDHANRHYGNAQTRIQFSSNNSNLQAIFVKLDDHPSSQYVSPLENLSAGAHVISFKGLRKDGAFEDESQFDILIDRQSPQISTVFTGPSRQLNDSLGSKVIIAPQTTMAAAVDDGAALLSSGLAKFEYQLDQSSIRPLDLIPNKLITLPIFHIAQVSSLGLNASDNVENSTSTRLRYQTDFNPPNTTLSYSMTPIVFNGVPTFSAQTYFQFNSSDDVAGVKQTQVAVNGGNFSPILSSTIQFNGSGFYDLKYRSIDYVENTEAPSSFSFGIDADAPTLQLKIAGDSYVHDGLIYITSSSSARLLVNDAGVGLKDVQVQLNIDSPFHYDGLSLPLKNDQFNTVQAVAMDRVNNQTDLTDQRIYIDTVAPVSSLTFNGPTISSGTVIVISSDTSIHFVSTDTGAGVKNFWVAIDSQPAAILYSDLFLSSGLHHLSYYAEDFLSQFEEPKELLVQVNVKSPPEIFAAPLLGQTFILAHRSVDLGGDPEVFSSSGPLLVSYSENTISTSPFTSDILFMDQTGRQRMKRIFFPEFESTSKKRMAFFIGDDGSSYFADSEHDGIIQNSELLSSSAALSNIHLARKAPEGLKIDDFFSTSSSSRTIIFKWGVPAEKRDSLRYQVLIATNQSGPYVISSLRKPIFNRFNGLMGMSLSGLNPGTTYFTALVSSPDNSSWTVNCVLSSTATLPTPPPPPDPHLVHDLKALSISSSAVQLTWTPPVYDEKSTGSGTFEIYVSSDPDGEFKNDGFVFVGQKKFWKNTVVKVFLDGLKSESTSYVKVISTYDLATRSEASNVALVKTLSTKLDEPAKPLIVSDVMSATHSYHYSGIGRFEYLLSTQENQYTLSSESLLYSLSADGKISSHVQGQKVDGVLRMTFMFDTELPSPSTLDITYRSKNNEVLTKTIFLPAFKTTGGNVMNLYVSEDGSTYYADEEHDGLLSEYRELLPSKTALTGKHLARKADLVVSISQVIPSAPSSSNSYLALPLESAQPKNNSDDIFVYPNPVKGFDHPTFHVDASMADLVHVSVFDISGHLVRNWDSSAHGTNGFEIPFEDELPSGVYLYVVVTEKENERPHKKTGKFSVMR